MSYQGRDVVLGGLFLALALVIPILFHAVGLGSAFLPMFFPIIAAGFLISPSVSLVVGITSPLFSALLTGMPPFFPPIAFIMMVEGVVLAGIPSLLYQKYRINSYLTLIITLLADRIVLFLAVIVISKWLDLPENVLGWASVIRGLPGIALIMLIIPPLIKKLREQMTTISLMG
ncbi:MAG: ECF transporter S component [Acidobacteriota bacterium]|jgi:LytS/YehU family sensor histidine kinase